MNLPEGTIVSGRRKKCACKNKPHDWQPVYRQLSVWPHEIEMYRFCMRCGRKNKRGIITGISSPNGY